ncbi:hypothetical protein ANN_10977 [Periplaneta americana]|uniref:Uncharacterized protein n=1 Tax=Periplaneta americana TaxID=6978 RepID=A0ABQ8T5H9_PERAM|nr:hypothetical protein ANN_10977 [Periplaneta americana]
MKEQEQEENNNRDEFSCHLKLVKSRVLNTRDIQARNKREKMATDRMVPSATNKRTKISKEIKQAERTSRDRAVDGGDTIKMDMRDVGYDDTDWINVAQDRDRWRAYVRAATNLRVP